MPGRKRKHGRDPLTEAVRDWKRYCISIETLLRDKLGLEPDSDLEDPLPKTPEEVNEFLEKLAKRDVPVSGRVKTAKCNNIYIYIYIY